MKKKKAKKIENALGGYRLAPKGGILVSLNEELGLNSNSDWEKNSAVADAIAERLANYMGDNLIIYAENGSLHFGKGVKE